MPSPPRKGTVYSAGEEAMMAASQQCRDRCLAPLLDLLARCGVTPNHLTYLSLAAGVGFAAVFCWNTPAARLAAMGLLALHVLLDGLDGPLARHTGTASNRGSFTDSTADQIVVAFSTLAMIRTHYADPLPGVLYVFLYTLVVVFAVVRNYLAIPYSWLVRPRFFVYAWFVVELYLLPGTLDYVLWLFNILLAAKMITGFYKIRRKL